MSHVTTCRCARPHVRRERFGLTGEWSWCAARPGEHYLVGHGLHFDLWADAIRYATRAAAGIPTKREGGE